jgi:hypothetical protein
MKKVILLVFLFLGTLLVFYTILPVIAYGFWELPLIISMTIIGYWMITMQLQTSQQGGKVVISRFHYSKIPLYILAVLLIYMTVVPIFTTWSLFHWKDYRALIGTVEEGTDLSQHMAPISIEKIRVVDQRLANILGDKVLGAQAALGSQVTLGTFNIQKVNNELYWVAPLLHSGFWKWNRNKKGTTGYVMVNATNERDVKLVQQADGKEIRIRYQPEAYFGDYLKRHLWFDGYFNKGLTDYTFEIDESGKPYWVITHFKKSIGFGGEETKGVVVVDTETGESNAYSIADAPAWIDRIQPNDLVETQLNDWGEFVKGYWNFSNQNKLQITEGVTLVYGEDNKVYWYTGLTSVGSDEATVGFVLVDTRTKKAIWYRQSGATEYAAQNSAMGKVQEKRFKASLPIPYNINNVPTYVMTLKDDGGLVKMFAMVAIEDYTIVGVGNTLVETLMAYKNSYNMAGNKISPQGDTQKVFLKAVVQRIKSDIKNGNSFYYFTVDSIDKIFIGSSQISNELPVTQPGDSIEISFDNDTQGLIDISSFVNRSLK